MIKNNSFEGNLTDAANVAAVSEMSNSSANASAKTRRKAVSDPVYAVLQKARAQFKRQVVQDTNTKRICIERNIPAFYSDPLRFWTEFRDEVNDLLDSIKFNSYCKENGLNKTYVAEHVVFEGRSTKNDVWRKGLGILGATVRMFNAPLYKDDAALFKKLKQITDGTEKKQTRKKITVEQPADIAAA